MSSTEGQEFQGFKGLTKSPAQWMKTDPDKETSQKFQNWEQREDLTSFQGEMTDHIQRSGIIKASEVSIATWK